MASKTLPSPDRVPLRELKPIGADEGIGWDALMKIVGPVQTAATVKHNKDTIKARQRDILTGWDEAAQVAKAKGKQPKPQQPIIRPSRVAAKNLKPQQEWVSRAEEVPVREAQPSLFTGAYD